MLLFKDQSVNTITETATTKACQDIASTFTYGANFEIVGKADPQNLSHPGAFQQVTGKMRDLADHIAQGHPWMPGTLNEGQKRWQNNVVHADVLAIDVDNQTKVNGEKFYQHQMTIAEALDHPLVKTCCGLGIPSASCAEDESWDKYRLVFRPTARIEGWEQVRIANRYLAYLLDQNKPTENSIADPACKDASRFFYGAPGRRPFLLDESKRLPESFLEDALKWHQENEAQEAKQAEEVQQRWEQWQSKNKDQDSDALLYEALNTINPDCDYNDWIAIGMALSGMGEQWFSAWDAWSAGASNYNVGEMSSKWKSFRGKEGNPGVIFGIAERYGFKFPSRESRKAQIRYTEAISATTKSQSEKKYAQTEWECLDTVDYKIGTWKEFSIDTSEEFRLTKAHEQTKTDLTLVFLGNYETKKGVRAKFQKFQPKADFTFEIESILTGNHKAGIEGGKVLKILRIEGNQLVSKSVFLKTSETSTIKDIVSAINRGYEANLPCTLSYDEWQALFQNRETVYRKNGGRTYRLAERTGKQSDGTWVLENYQFKSAGTPTNSNESGWVFNHLLGETEQIPSPKIAPQDSKALNRLVLASKKVFAGATNHGYLLLELGKVAAIMQRDQVMDKLGYFPQAWVMGEKNAGKTFAATIALSMIGMQRFTIAQFSESVLYERFKSLGCLPFLVDDPVKPGKNQRETKESVEKILWNSYNGFSRTVRQNEQIPHTCALWTGNVSAGEGIPALESRLLKWDFPKQEIDKTHEDELNAAMDQASGGFSQLAAIKYDHEAFRDIAKRLKPQMSDVESRIIEALAISIFFTQEVLKAADYEFDVFGFCIEHIVPQMISYESSKDSLTDFLEKLEQLQATDQVGAWCVREVVTREGGRFLAVFLAEVWGTVAKAHILNYSRQGLQSLIEAAGGRINTTQKFVGSRLEWIDYQRAIAEWKRRTPEERQQIPAPYEPKPTAQRKCVLIPANLFPWERSEDPTGVTPQQETETPKQAELDDWINTESKSDEFQMRPSVTKFKPHPDGWEPKHVGDPVEVMDRSGWVQGIVTFIPTEEKRCWKVAIEDDTQEDGERTITIHHTGAMRPVEVA
ncbi:PriCT-2 domain-containing protein [Cyanobacteria bacterium FACHB-63]|nr:PriCT-2 domain-containing protein [Cyanobacteria bacterium FACHB-63]